MIDSILNTAIKLALIQTVPGEEFNVRNKLKEACEQEPKIKKSIFLKALGCFDIMVIYLTDDFGYHLSKAGPIDNILKSNLLLCYSYLSSDVQKIFNSLESNSFAGVSLLKIHPGVQQRYNPQIEKTFREAFENERANWFLIGSLGWNEIIFLVSENDLNSINQQLLSLSTIYLQHSTSSGVKNISGLIKTLSFLGMNYAIIPDFDIKKAGFSKTKSYLERNSFLANTNIVMDRRKGIVNAPIIEVSAKPMYTNQIKKYFRGKGFRGYDLLGKQDLFFVPERKMSWAQLVSSVLYFRHGFKDKVFSTNIRVRSDTIQSSPKQDELKLEIPPLSFTYEQIRGVYNDNIAAGLANSFYSFNSLSQNPICGSAFIDMLEYPSYIKEVGPKIHDKLEFAYVAREVLRYGAELRSYGTFESIEEVTGKFSELRGGCQRALLAIEFLPTYLFEAAEELWCGFVITHPSNKFDHINEVIRVPTDTLWNPQKWWALYHEIAHIMIENNPEWIPKDLIDQFLRNRIYPEYWKKVIFELGAEVVGFELGFFGDYELFFRLLWRHIVEIDPPQKSSVPIQTYALRSFFIKLFLGRFTEYNDVERISESDFTDLQYLYNKFIEHLKKIEAVTNNALGQTYAANCFLAAENVKALKDMYPIARNLSNKISKRVLRPAAKYLEEKETKSIQKRLNDGKIWWKKISCPQAVLYYLIQDENMEFRKRIATLLTFWNQQMILMGKRLR